MFLRSRFDRREPVEVGREFGTARDVASAQRFPDRIELACVLQREVRRPAALLLNEMYVHLGDGRLVWPKGSFRPGAVQGAKRRSVPFDGEDRSGTIPKS